MIRLLSPLLIASLLAAPARTQQADNKVLGKTLPEWLTMLRENENARFRRASLIALEVYGPKHAGVLPGIITALRSDKDVEVRRTAAQTLGRMGVEARSAVELLGETLQKDKDATVREAAARALGGAMVAESHTQVPALAAALQDAHAGTRAAAAESLRDLGEKARGALPAIVMALENPKLDDYTRIYSAQIVGSLGQNFESAYPALAACAGDTAASAKVRLAAIDALAGLGESARPATDLLVKTLDDPNAGELRLAAAITLEKIDADPKTCWPAVKKTLTAPQAPLRHQAIRLAGRAATADAEAVTELARSAAKDESTENRLAAIQELTELGPIAKAAEGTLATIARDDARASVRQAATTAVKAIKGGM